MKFQSFLYTFLSFILLTACSDELQLPWDDDYAEPGLPATITLRYSQIDPNSQVSSRTELTEAAAKQIDDLWVGVFSVDEGATFGNLKFSHTYTGSDLPDQNGCNGIITITGDALSGRSVIVAIANTTKNKAILQDDAQQVTLEDAPTIAALLAQQGNNLTLEQYMRIVGVLNRSDQVTQLSGSLLMSGTYSTQADPATNQHTPERFPATPEGLKGTQVQSLPGYVTIQPGQNNLTGFIRLERNVSYVKFNIVAGPNITVEPLGWQVFDLPQMSLVAERTISAGDLFKSRNDTYASSTESNKFENGHKATAQPNGAEWVDDGSTTAKCFDFYIFNHCRTGVEAVTRYGDRDKEFKNADGTMQALNGLQGPYFTSLMSSLSAQDLYLNHSPYVQVRMKISYWIKAQSREELVNPNSAAVVVAPSAVPNEASVQPASDGFFYYQRVAIVKAIVHLGYCEGANEAEKAKDFNVRRNTRYAYNLTVNGVRNIRVEALKGGENQPSWSGDVTDAEQSFTGLDAHYCVFNVLLPKPGSGAKLSFTIKAPHGINGTQETEVRYDAPTATTTERNEMPNVDKKFWDWIEFCPTTNKTTLAAYPGRNDDGTCKGDLKNLQQMVDAYNVVNSDVAATDQQWYTVFINEHVYDGMNWQEYVNNNGRTITLRAVPEYVSEDQASSYSHSIIYIQQNSVSTFYDATESDQTIKALGLEWENETFGLNMLWNETSVSKTLSEENGYYNIWQYIKVGDPWSNYVDQTATQHVNAVNKPAFNFSSPAKDVPLPALQKQTADNGITSMSFSEATTTYGHSWFPAPEDPYVYNVIYMCLSRNRDLNGDGKIQPNEIRWILPAAIGMEKMVLGTRALPTPLVDYNAGTKLPGWGWSATPGERQQGLNHYITSSGRMLWADQHMVLDGKNTNHSRVQRNDNQNANNTRGNYWQMRCIRLLDNNGTWAIPDNVNYREYDDLVSVTGPDNGGVYTMTVSHLSTACTRAATSGAIRFHRVNEYDYNSTAKVFQFKAPVQIPSGNNTVLNWESYVNAGNYGLGDGWRVANFQELALICIYVPAFNQYSNSIFSSTGTQFTIDKDDNANPFRILGYTGGNDHQLQALKSGEAGYYFPVKDVR